MRLTRGSISSPPSTNPKIKLPPPLWAARLTRAFSPGSYELTVVARDIAGNISAPSRAVSIRIPIVALPVHVHPKVGTRFAVRLKTDGRQYRWQLGRKHGISRARRLILHAPQAPGRYTFVVRQHGDHAAVRVIVRTG